MNFKNIIAVCGALLLTASCQNWDLGGADPILKPLSEDAYTSQLQGDALVWTWTQSGNSTQVSIYANGTIYGSEVVTGNSYMFSPVNTNIQYTFVFKETDGTNFSQGVVKLFLREGASQITGISMSQVDKDGGYDALVTWNKPADATQVKLTATNGKQTKNETLSANTTSYTISDVIVGDTWTVTLVAVNDKGTSLSASSSLRIGKTAIGFLSEYATPEELIANGDDDEASAWLWLHETYPTAQYVYFGDITSTDVVEPYRVLFWLRDKEGVGEDVVLNMPDLVKAATPYVKEWYKNGGSLLLWSHAMPYLAELGRIDISWISNNDHTIGTGEGGYNPDIWRMGVGLNPGGRFSVDFSTHPLYKGLEMEQGDRVKLLPLKGPGWTEDHNCLFFNQPSALTGLGNQEQACYQQCTSTYGIYPLGVWDSQIDWVSQLNVWEAQQGNTEYQGTALCIGNGGCEFSMKNADGTPDKSAHPKNNIYQDNILKMATNALEYLKTR